MSDSEKEFQVVTIASIGRIPFINRSGPISQPTTLSTAIVKQLKEMGYQISIHNETYINSVTGNREVVFESAPEGHAIEVQTDTVPPVIAPTENSLPVTLPKEVVEITPPVVEEEKKDTEETVEEPEEVQVEIYDMATYKGWSVEVLRKYLAKLEDYLKPEVFAEVASAKKAELLDIIEKHVLPLAEEAGEEETAE